MSSRSTSALLIEIERLKEENWRYLELSTKLQWCKETNDKLPLEINSKNTLIHDMAAALRHFQPQSVEYNELIRIAENVK